MFKKLYLEIDNMLIKLTIILSVHICFGVSEDGTVKGAIFFLS